MRDAGVMKVLFATAVDPVSEVQNRYRPLWPTYLAAMSDKELGAENVEFRYCQGDLAKELETFNPDFLAVSSVTQNFNYLEGYANAAKKRSIPVILGGMHISAMPASLPRDVELGCIGEGEETFVELLKIWLDHGEFPKKYLADVKGIVYRENGNIIVTPDRPPIPSFDYIPHPKRSLIGYGKRDYLFTSRGCQYKCVFCQCARYWGPIRYMSADRVIDELEELVENGVKTIRFNDDNFVGNKVRLKEIAEKIIKKGYHRRARFSCWGRSNNITPDVVKTLKSMNMVSVVMGLESGSERTLKYLKGNVSVEDNRRAIELLKDAGIQANGDFIIGSPQETDEEIMETYEFIRKSRIDFVTINVFSPLPGTPVWEDAKERKLVSDDMDWSKVSFKFNESEDECINMSEVFSHQQLYKIHKKFKRLSMYRNLRALPHTPWLNELPGVALKLVRQRLARLKD